MRQRIDWDELWAHGDASSPTRRLDAYGDTLLAGSAGPAMPFSPDETVVETASTWTRALRTSSADGR